MTFSHIGIPNRIMSPRTVNHGHIVSPHHIVSSSRTVGPYQTTGDPLAVIHTRLDHSDRQTEGVHAATNYSIISQGGIQVWGHGIVRGTFVVNRSLSPFMGLDSRMLTILHYTLQLNFHKNRLKGQRQIQFRLHNLQLVIQVRIQVLHLQR